MKYSVVLYFFNSYVQFCLQRSSSVPDSQLSPVGSYPGLGSVPSPGQRRPFSPVK